MGNFVRFPTVANTMTDVTLDDRGRLTIPKKIRERFGERYQLVQLQDSVKLIPVDEEPLAALRAEFADVDASVEELQAAAREEALDEAGR